MNEKCVFCKIVQHKKEEAIVYEDKDAVVFPDSSPRTSYHYLIVPKQHFHDFSDMMSKSPELLTSIGRSVEAVVDKLDIRGGWYTWGFHAGGKQTVNHVHAQLLAGMKEDELVL